MAAASEEGLEIVMPDKSLKRMLVHKELGRLVCLGWTTALTYSASNWFGRIRSAPRNISL